MMATTHALWGMLLAVPVVVFAPELAPFALFAGLVGGLAPDLDLYVGHRRSLHYPVYGWVVAVGAVAVSLLSPSVATVALAIGATAAALHAASDVIGGGLELRPWTAGTDRAVYSHFHGRWLDARRWIRYDGAPEDLALAGVAGLVVIVATADVAGADHATPLVVGLLAASGVYVLLRKSLAEVAVYLASQVPAVVRPYVPARYLDS